MARLLIAIALLSLALFACSGREMATDRSSPSAAPPVDREVFVPATVWTRAVRLSGISGHVDLGIREPLPCPHCNGTGKLRE